MPGPAHHRYARVALGQDGAQGFAHKGLTQQGFLGFGALQFLAQGRHHLQHHGKGVGVAGRVLQVGFPPLLGVGVAGKAGDVGDGVRRYDFALRRNLTPRPPLQKRGGA